MSRMKSFTAKDAIILLIVISAVGYGWYQEQQLQQLKELPQKYVIGKVTDKLPTKKRSKIRYAYVLNLETYRSETYERPHDDVKVGDRYFVSVPIIIAENGYAMDESQGFILFDHPVPDSITHTPVGGWRELPVQ